MMQSVVVTTRDQLLLWYLVAALCRCVRHSGNQTWHSRSKSHQYIYA